MQLIEILSIVIGSGGVIGFAAAFIRMGKVLEKVESHDKYFEKIDERFQMSEEKMSDHYRSHQNELERSMREINETFKRIDAHLHSIDIRLAVLEAEQLWYNTEPDFNTRSEAAKAMWKKRKAKEHEQLSVK
jgi:esterase/lipase